MHSFRSICQSVHDNGRKNIKKAKNSYQQEDCISSVQRSVCLHHSPHLPRSRQFHVVCVHGTEARRIKEADWSSGCWTLHVFYRSRARSLERYDFFASKCCGTMAHAYMRWILCDACLNMKANPSPQGKPKHTGVLLKLTRELIMLTGVLIMQGSK